MSGPRKANTARRIVEDVLGRAMTEEIWSGNYHNALPISIMNFDIGAVLPAVLFMFRYGHRRGRGGFLETYGGQSGTHGERRRSATASRIAEVLSSSESLSESFVGFSGEVELAVLADLLLCYCLENSRRALGRAEQVQRVAPTHYMASWVDLPDSVAHLRYVPEMIVALLADQGGEWITQSKEGDKPTRFPVGSRFEDNLLLRAFYQGMSLHGELGSRTSDRFDEEAAVGLDQLLTIRLAQRLGRAPERLRGKGGEKIPNRLAVAEKMSRQFAEDIRRFIRQYSEPVPRHAFSSMLESCIAVGLTTIIGSAVVLLFEWAETGHVRHKAEQEPPPLFVDCSNGIDRQLRTLAEHSFDDFMRRLSRLPVILMLLRLMDYSTRYNPKARQHYRDCNQHPYATDLLNLLGDFIFERIPDTGGVSAFLGTKAEELAEKLSEEHPEVTALLTDESTQPSAAWRMAEGLTLLQGRQLTHSQVTKLVDSATMVDRPNGIMLKRTTYRQTAGSSRGREVRSLVLTDSALEYLVHLSLLPSGSGNGHRSVSLVDFLSDLRTTYGLCVDAAPKGMTISNQMLTSNRSRLERRLRDLGLLYGVNDAEAMKRLVPRFKGNASNGLIMDTPTYRSTEQHS